MESLIALFKAEPFKKTYDIGGVKVTLRMLTREQYDDVMSRANISTEDLISKEALIRRPILGYSLQDINGVKLSDIKEVKDIIDETKGALPVNLAVERALGKFDASFIDTLFGFYNTLVEDDTKNKEELKKA